MNVRPILEYADVIWDNCPNYMKEKLEHINYEAARIIIGATKLTSIRILLQECGWGILIIYSLVILTSQIVKMKVISL